MDQDLQQISELAAAIDRRMADLTAQRDQAIEANKAMSAATSQQLVANQHLMLTLQDATAKLATMQALISQLAPFQVPIVYPDLNKGPIAQWTQPGNAGNTGGASSTPHGTYSIEPGDPAVFAIKPACAYDNFYWYTNLGPAPHATRFLWEADILFPSAEDLAAAQAIEWELEQCINGDVWNMGWQLKLQGTTCWRYFDYVNTQWCQTQVPVDMVRPGEPLRISAEYLRNGISMEHVALTLNGQRYEVHAVKNNKPGRWPASANYVHYAFQMDANGKAAPYKVLLSKMRAAFL
jgi:hypothetical protein